MSNDLPAPQGEFLLYTTEDGRTRVECRFEDETIWLSQALMAELFDRDVRTINEHLKTLYETEEIDPNPTIRKFRIVRQEGKRQVAWKDSYTFAERQRAALENRGAENSIQRLEDLSKDLPEV